MALIVAGEKAGAASGVLAGQQAIHPEVNIRGKI
jgi:hypothetical protein